MDSLRDIVNKKRIQPLKDFEIQDVVKKCFETSGRLEDDYSRRSKIHLYLVKGILEGMVNPDRLLVESIKFAKEIRDLILIGLALRNGANSNLYVELQSLGKAHILIYTAVYVMKNPIVKVNDRIGIRNNLLALLQLGGSSPNQLAFVEETKIDNPIDVDSALLSQFGIEQKKPKIQRLQVETVKDWFQKNECQNCDDVKYLLGGNRDLRKIIGTMIDNPDLVFGKEMAERLPPIDFVLASHAKQIISQFPRNKTNEVKVHGENQGLLSSIQMCNSQGYVHFLTLGLEPTYFTINRLCVLLNESIRKQDLVLSEVYSDMIFESVKHGSKMDLKQLTLISNVSNIISTSIIQLYGQPSWKKVCYNPMAGTIPQQTKELAFNLNVDPSQSKSEVCSKLRVLSESDSIALKEAAKERQRMRVSNSVSGISDFVSGSPKPAVCANNTSLQKDPFLYNDATMTFFRDSSDTVWCFTSDMYESLIESKTNPYKPSEPLPQPFIEQIESHLKIMKSLNISPSDPVSTDKAIDSLSEPDEISSKESIKTVNTFERLAKYNGIVNYEGIRKLTSQQLQNFLITFGMEQNYLSELDEEHRFITFCNAILAISTKDNIKSIFSNLTDFSK